MLARAPDSRTGAEGQTLAHAPLRHHGRMTGPRGREDRLPPLLKQLTEPAFQPIRPGRGHKTLEDRGRTEERRRPIVGASGRSDFLAKQFPAPATGRVRCLMNVCLLTGRYLGDECDLASHCTTPR